MASISKINVAGTNYDISASNIPTKVSQLTNDSGFLTSVSDKTVDIKHNSTFNTPNNTVVVPSALMVGASPYSGTMVWHDLWAYCRLETPKYYTSADNTTWTESTVDKTMFFQKGTNSKTILNSTVSGARWLWGTNTSGFSWSSGQWLVIGVTYQDPLATYTVVFDTSADGETWTVRHESTGRNQTSPVYFKLVGYNGDRYLRLTITKNPTDTGTLNIGQLRLLTARYGSQGNGIDLEYPYNWDAIPNIYPIWNNTQSLGTSSIKWSNVYATTFNGNLTGNVNGGLTAPNRISGQTALDNFIEQGTLKYGTFDQNSGTGLTDNDGLVISLGWNTSTTYGAQIIIDDTKASGLRFRGKSSTWGDWREVLHTGNIATLLSAVASSGSYNDLTDKPTIPSAVTESTVSGWGFTKNTGTYSKPSGGIPKTDLASAVQTSLGKADSALQSIPTASASVLGGVKVGSGLSISNGVLSATGGGGGLARVAYYVGVTMNGNSPSFTFYDSAWNQVSTKTVGDALMERTDVLGVLEFMPDNLQSLETVTLYPNSNNTVFFGYDIVDSTIYQYIISFTHSGTNDYQLFYDCNTVSSGNGGSTVTYDFNASTAVLNITAVPSSQNISMVISGDNLDITAIV